MGYMSYYDNATAYQERGIDYDLAAAIENNYPGIGLDDIGLVLAVIEGVKDEEDWYWIVVLKNGKYAYLDGWCDYTGWDCRSNLECIICDDVESALFQSGNPGEGNYDELKRQVDAERKNPTWREITHQSFPGVLYGVDLTKIKQNVVLRQETLKALPNLLPEEAPQPQPYAPDYEVLTLNAMDSIMVSAGLLRERVWFVVRPVEESLYELVVKYADRERLLFYAGAL